MASLRRGESQVKRDSNERYGQRQGQSLFVLVEISFDLPATKRAGKRRPNRRGSKWSIWEAKVIMLGQSNGPAKSVDHSLLLIETREHWC